MIKSDIRGESKIVSVSSVFPNTWNPKKTIEESRENMRQYKRILKSILLIGQVEPILVRTVGKRYQILNGFHRHKVISDLDWEHIWVHNFGEMSDDTAKRLSIATEGSKVPLDELLTSDLILGILEGKEFTESDLHLDELDIKTMKDVARYDGKGEIDEAPKEKAEKDKSYSIILPESHKDDWLQLKSMHGLAHDSEMLIWLIENSSQNEE